MFISIFPLFFIFRQEQIQPVITTNNSTISRPTKAPPGITMFERVNSTLELFISGEHVDDDAG